MSQIEHHLSKLKSSFSGKIISPDTSKENRLKFYVNQENLLEIMTFISQELMFPSLEAVSGVDWETHFEVVYHIDRWDGDSTVIQVHVKLEDRDNPQVPSLTSIVKLVSPVYSIIVVFPVKLISSIPVHVPV